MSLSGLQVADQLPAGGSDRRVGGVPKDLIRALLLLEREVRKVLLLDVACIPRSNRQHKYHEPGSPARLDR